MNEESLIQDTPVESAPTDTPQNTPDGSAPAWSWGEDLPGEGDAPEWLKADKYSSVADQAKAYTDLEKKFGSFTGAPDEYAVPAAESFSDIELPEGVDFTIDAEDPLLVAFMPVAKDMGLSQEGFDKVMGVYINQQVADYSATMTTAAEEKKALGDNADERLSNVESWAKANFDQSTFDKLRDLLTTADAVDVAEQLISKTRNASLPNPAAVKPAPAHSREEYNAMMGEKDGEGRLKYMSDPEFRKKVQRVGEQVFGREPGRTIVG